VKRHRAPDDFVAAYLRKIGVRHVFGIPRDLALKLFFGLGNRHGLEILRLSQARHDDLYPVTRKYIQAAAWRSNPAAPKRTRDARG